MRYEPQRLSRKRKLEGGWKRVEAFLDPETAKRWAKLVDDHGGPTALVKAALEALERSAERSR
jgi:hypothetical protein